MQGTPSLLSIDLQLFSEDEDFILPDETPDETAPPQAEEENTAETVEETKPTEEAEEPAVEQPKIKVKFNHEERELTLDEAVTLSQKGLNYDKLQEKLKALETDPRLSKYDKVQQLADYYGMSDEEMLDALYNQYYESTAQEKGLTAEQIRKETELKQKEQALRQKEETLTKSEADKQMYAKFFEAFPTAKAEDIKPETWAMVNNGMDLTTAYIMQQNNDLQAKIKTMEQNLANAQKAPVSGVTAHGSTETAPEDDFLKGFNSI